MCLIVFSWNRAGPYKLIMAANRDEYFNRPTITADFWKDNTGIFGGRDSKAGGSWLAFNKNGKWAALTNYRESTAINKKKRSRGLLVSEYLSSDLDPREYSQKLDSENHLYAGYNLLLGSNGDIYYKSNRAKIAGRIEPGVNGLSNHLLNTDWPKVKKSRKRLENCIKESRHNLIERLFTLLSDDKTASIEEVPQTGLSIDWEITLSSIFIKSNHAYGTRSSTVFTIGYDNSIFFEERSFDSYCNEINRNSINLPPP